MKKILLLLMLIPFLGFAQTPAKYLAGAVPVVDGKVTFTQTIRIPNKSKAEVFSLVEKWAQEHFQADLDFPTQKLITADADKGEIGALGEEFIVFSQAALSLDRTRIYYQFRAQCEDEKCALTMTRLRYWYNETRDKGERYNAEDIITDEHALNKAQDKLTRVIGKFRMKTIDYKDELFKSVASSITDQIQNPGKANQTAEEKQKEAEQSAPTEIVIKTIAPPLANPVVKETPTVTPSSEEFPGYHAIDVAEIPGNIYEMLSQHWMLITSGTADAFNTMTASWGGLGNLYQSPVSFCFINPSRYTYQFMEKNDTYTLSFFPDECKAALKLLGSKSGRDGDKVKESGLSPITTPSGTPTFGEATLILECQKLVAQSLTPEALKDEQLKQQWEGKAMHKMYIGKILRVWVK